MDVREAVRRIAILGELNETESSAITERVVRLDLKRGEELVREGDESDPIFVVLFGRFWHARTLGRDAGLSGGGGRGEGAGAPARLLSRLGGVRVPVSSRGGSRSLLRHSLTGRTAGTMISQPRS
jgi:hypothetical protein